MDPSLLAMRVVTVKDQLVLAYKANVSKLHPPEWNHTNIVHFLSFISYLWLTHLRTNHYSLNVISDYKSFYAYWKSWIGRNVCLNWHYWNMSKLYSNHNTEVVDNGWKYKLHKDSSNVDEFIVFVCTFLLLAN